MGNNAFSRRHSAASGHVKAVGQLAAVAVAAPPPHRQEEVEASLPLAVVQLSRQQQLSVRRCCADERSVYVGAQLEELAADVAATGVVEVGIRAAAAAAAAVAFEPRLKRTCGRGSASS